MTPGVTLVTHRWEVKFGPGDVLEFVKYSQNYGVILKLNCTNTPGIVVILTKFLSLDVQEVVEVTFQDQCP